MQPVLGCFQWLLKLLGVSIGLSRMFIVAAVEWDGQAEGVA